MSILSALILSASSAWISFALLVCTSLIIVLSKASDIFKGIALAVALLATIAIVARPSQDSPNVDEV